MDKEVNSLEKVSESEIHQIKEKPSLWKWYFGWHPRFFLTVPAFLIFVYSGIWFIGKEFSDVISFFQTKPVTWGAIFVMLLLGSFLVWFIIAPIYISFMSIGWLYEINIENYSAWKKFLYSIGIMLLVIVGATIIRDVTAWLLGIL